MAKPFFVIKFPGRPTFFQYFLFFAFFVGLIALFSFYAYQTFQVNTAIKEAVGKYHVKFKLAHDIAMAESSLNPRARGRDGGLGLYQFMPKTWEWATKKVYGKSLPFPMARNLKTNAEVGVWFIAWIEKTLKKQNVYSEAAVVYCFNAGIGKFRDRGYIPPRDHKNKVYDKYFARYYRQLAEASKSSA